MNKFINWFMMTRNAGSKSTPGIVNVSGNCKEEPDLKKTKNIDVTLSSLTSSCQYIYICLFCLCPRALALAPHCPSRQEKLATPMGEAETITSRPRQDRAEASKRRGETSASRHTSLQLALVATAVRDWKCVVLWIRICNEMFWG